VDKHCSEVKEGNGRAGGELRRGCWWGISFGGRGGGSFRVTHAGLTFRRNSATRVLIAIYILSDDDENGVVRGLRIWPDCTRTSANFKLGGTVRPSSLPVDFELCMLGLI